LLAQLELAEEVGLPVIFHIRDAYPETRAVIEESGIPGQGAVLHAFAGDVATARWARRHRLLLGIGGPLTYKNSRLPAVLNEAAVTADDLLLETDAPWLPPVPYRGKRNESAYLGQVLTQLATVLGMDAAEVSAGTDAAFGRLFGERYAVCNEDRNGSPARGTS
jgi:TatD DNase family protein